MPEVLQGTPAFERVRTLPGPIAVLDPTTAAVLEAAVTEASVRARREGESAGRAAAADAADRASVAVVAALDALRAEVRSQREEATRVDLGFARDVAAAVLERTPPDEALAVLDRIRRAVEALDERPLQVRLHPGDLAALAPVCGDGLELLADPALAPGDARVVGVDGGADLTRGALLAAAAGLLAEGRA